MQTLWEVLHTIDNLGGWVNHVSFENQGKEFLLLTHGPLPRVYSVGGAKVLDKESKVNWNNLPFMNGYLTSNGFLVAAGYDNKVALFKKKGKYVLTKATNTFLMIFIKKMNSLGLPNLRREWLQN